MQERIRFLEYLSQLRGLIADACARAGRDPEEVAILPVTKTFPVEVVGLAAEAGLGAVGENRVQEAVAKREQWLASGGDPALRWELIGHLQSNKAALAVEHFDRISSVDSLRLLQRIDRLAGEKARRIEVLLEANPGGDPGKFGFQESEFARIADEIVALRNLEVRGLLTVAPLQGGAAAARRAFAGLREIRDDLEGRTGLSLPVLSMGMSGDLEVAILEGSTQVRIGSWLYGSRSSTA